jgi:hypothetical protein
MEPYGISKPEPAFSQKDKDVLRESNYHTLKTLAAAKHAHDCGVAFAVERPDRIYDDQVSMCDLQEYKDLAALPGVREVVTDQCMFGALSKKPTVFLVFTLSDPASWLKLPRLCDHPMRPWAWTDLAGKRHESFGSHLPLVGRKNGHLWATSAAETYPPDLNKALADCIMTVGKARRGSLSN